MICPQCNLDLETAPDSDPPVYHCGSCSGTWIGGYSLNSMLAKSNDSSSIEQILNSILELDYRESERVCPRCIGRRLKVVVIEHTELDFCASCKGIFFDPGELQKLLPSIGIGALRPRRARGFWAGLKRLLDQD